MPCYKHKKIPVTCLVNFLYLLRAKKYNIFRVNPLLTQVYYKPNFMSSLINNHTTELAELSGNVKQIQQVCYKAIKKAAGVVQGKIQLDYQFSSGNYIIHYNEQGFKVSDEIYATDGRYVNMYNDKFFLVETLHYSRDGKLFKKTIYTYNSKGINLEVISRDANGNLLWRTENILNENLIIIL